MTSKNIDHIFADRRIRLSRRSVYKLARIGPDRRVRAERRGSNGNYADASWWLQVDYFDGCYIIKPGVTRNQAVFKSPDNLQKL